MDDMNDFFSMMEKLQGLLEKPEIEVVTKTGIRVRGRIDNLRSTQPFSKPAVKIRGLDGKITKVLFSEIHELIDRSA
jgi:hypothetical protein